MIGAHDVFEHSAHTDVERAGCCRQQVVKRTVWAAHRQDLQLIVALSDIEVEVFYDLDLVEAHRLDHAG